MGSKNYWRKKLKIKKILLLEGGYNEEHEISLATGKEVKKAILEMNYELDSIIVNPKDFYNQIHKHEFDVCFNALHGPFGEDGTIQNILYNINKPFTHSGEYASAIAFDKHLTKLKIRKEGVLCLDSCIIEYPDLNKGLLNKKFEEIGPFVLKPISSGSSYGVQIIKSYANIDNLINKSDMVENIYKNHNKLMIEKYINGKELTVAVMEDEKVSKSIEVTEIISKNIFFDYEAKYSAGMSNHILPAKIPPKIYDQCLFNAKKVHDTLGCRGITRSDFIYDEINQQLLFLEINTQPGLTPISLVPEQLNVHGINFSSLVNNLINASSCSK